MSDGHHHPLQMHSNARELVDRMNGRWFGNYGKAPCPAHDDKTPSLSIKESDEGKILWRCHAGCSQEDVRRALMAMGLLGGVSHDSKPDKAKSVIDATYDYEGPDGQLLYQVVRFLPKSFKQRRPNGRGGWTWNLKGVERVPYRLPALVGASTELVFIVEGEKDADRLTEFGLIATCSPGGAGKWRRDYNSYFKSKRVVILPDNDEAGRKHAEDVAANLHDVAAQVRVVELPGLEDKGDVSDWITKGGTKAKLVQISEAAPLWERDPGNWYSRASVSARGNVLNNHANAMLALRSDPAWRGVFGYNEMRDQVMLLRPVPQAGKPLGEQFPSPIPWTDDNDAQAQEYLQLIGFPHMGKDKVATAISQRAKELRYHPVRDYLDGLRWDGIPRIKGGLTADGDSVEPFFVNYFGAENEPYTSAVGIMFLVSAVARVMKPGSKVDHVVILEGRQGIGKSSSIRILAGEEYFSDGLPEIGRKDAVDHLRGKWFIEIAELDAMTRAEDTAFKAFITRQADKFRPPYGHREIEWPRQCVFVGTTNKSVYLKDETGGRRYWPISCKSIDLTSLERDRDQIWAEADHLYRKGHPWHITDPELRAEAGVQQKQRYDADVWEEKIANYIAARDSVTVTEIMETALGIETPRLDRAGQNRVMKVLSNLGWIRDKRSTGGRTVWVRQSKDE